MPLVTTFTPKRALLASCFAMTAIFTLGAQPDYGDTIAGPSVNALIEAYESFGMGPDEKAPFLLEPYVVVIEQYGTSIRLTFDEHSTATLREVIIDAKSNLIVQPKDDQSYEGMILLPGVVAGEMIAAYRYILATASSPEIVARLKSAAYNVAYAPARLGTSLVFFPAKTLLLLTNPRFEATPTPRPGWTCLAGACDGQFANYIVRLRDGQVTFERRAVL
jgi:hypothetical protein